MGADVVLVHGGWHNSACWERVVAGLSAFGLSADAVQLPLDGFSSDVEAVRRAIQTADRPPVVVAHSYGGVVLSEAAAGLRGGVSHLIYVAAFLLEASERPDEYLSADLSAALSIDGEGRLQVDPAQAPAIFYGDQDSETIRSMVSQLRGMRVDGRAVARSTPAWRTSPVTYVVCANDRAIPASAQRVMAARTQHTIELPTDHSPFLGHPSTIAGIIADRVLTARR